MMMMMLALALSIDGSWAAKVPTPNGQRSMDVVFTFHTTGSTLTGTASANGSTFDLVNTKVDGDRIAFAVEGDSGRFEGTVGGDEMKLQAIYASGENGTRRWDFVAKRMADSSATIAGAWSGEVPRGGDTFIHADMDFEVNGATLGGTVHALDLELPVKNGKINGSRISFKVGDSNGDYAGELAGDTLRMTVKYRGGETGNLTLDFVLTRRK